MAMNMLHNAGAQLSLGELNKNISKIGKALTMISSGQKINSAADDSASFAISEIMRVKLRALEQDIQNVQNGSTMLKTAEAGVQQQINILKSIKAKVIDAANDHNTDEDRRIIQKEINQLYDQMEQDAVYTEYNTKKLLLGDTFKQTAQTWVALPTPIELPDSGAMNVIPDNFEVLDNLNGPFDIFEEVSIGETTFKSVLGGEPIVSLEGGGDGTPRIIDADFSSYGSVDELNNVGIRIDGMNAAGSMTSRVYVFTDDASKNYRGATKIDIGDCNSVEDAVSKLKRALDSFSSYAAPEANGETLRLTSGNKTEAANLLSCPNVIGISGASGKDPVPQVGRSAGISDKNFSGGSNPSGRQDDPDSAYHPAKTATYTASISGAAVPSGFSVSYSGRLYQIEFTDSSDGPSWNEERQVYNVGKRANFSDFSFGNFKMSLSRGSMTLEASSPGS